MEKEVIGERCEWREERCEEERNHLHSTMKVKDQVEYRLFHYNQKEYTYPQTACQ
jgi:hypothetical protein